MHSSPLESTIEANRREAEGRILDRVCPIYGINGRRQYQLIGSSVLLKVASRSFVLTAAHGLYKNRDSTLYIAGGTDIVALAGSSFRSGSPTANRDDDRLDFGFIEISDTPLDQWSRFRFLTPGDLDVDDIPVAESLYAFVGFPETRNRVLSGRRLQLNPVIETVMPTSLERYPRLGLNPLAHFAGDFSLTRLNAQGKTAVGPKPHGLSGGGVWRLGTFHELATCTNAEKLIGLGIEYRSNPSVLVAVRISAVVALLTDTHPELAGYLPAPTRASFLSSIPGVGTS